MLRYKFYVILECELCWITGLTSKGVPLHICTSCLWVLMVWKLLILSLYDNKYNLNIFVLENTHFIISYRWRTQKLTILEKQQCVTNRLAVYSGKETLKIRNPLTEEWPSSTTMAGARRKQHTYSVSRCAIKSVYAIVKGMTLLMKGLGMYWIWGYKRSSNEEFYGVVCQKILLAYNSV